MGWSSLDVPLKREYGPGLEHFFQFNVTTGLQEFCSKYSSIEAGGRSDDVVSVAGRIYSMRASGAKLVFYDLRAEGMTHTDDN